MENIITREMPIVFDGLVAENYDDLLGAFIFEPFAVDLAEKSNIQSAERVLELASGTGRLTRHLSNLLPAKASFTATDLKPGMIAVAKKRVDAPNIHWQTADISSLPYDDNTFDLIVCQFGVMFTPDKVQALKEIYRVLSPGGRLIFSTWGPIENNKSWQIAQSVVNSFLGSQSTPIFEVGPFAMSNEKEVLFQLQQAGFRASKVISVEKDSEIDSALTAAEGFITGLPTLNLINARIPELLGQVVEKLEEELASEMGDHPLRTSFQAWKFEAVK